MVGGDVVGVAVAPGSGVALSFGVGILVVAGGRAVLAVAAAVVVVAVELVIVRVGAAGTFGRQFRLDGLGGAAALTPTSPRGPGSPSLSGRRSRRRTRCRGRRHCRCPPRLRPLRRPRRRSRCRGCNGGRRDGGDGVEALVAKAVSDDGGRVATATVMAVARTAAAHHFADSGVGER